MKKQDDVLWKKLSRGGQLTFFTPVPLLKATLYVICNPLPHKRFCAKVVDKDEETEEVVVHFDGWSSRYDELLHIRDGKLRHLTQEQLEKTKAQKTKVGGVFSSSLTHMYIHMHTHIHVHTHSCTHTHTHTHTHFSPPFLTPPLYLCSAQILQVGDRVQAKWQDGRMYFGKVLQLLKGEYMQKYI